MARRSEVHGLRVGDRPGDRHARAGSASRRGARPRPGGHGDERLQRPGRPGRGDDGRVRSREGQGLRHLARALDHHPGRTRREGPHDARPGERRGMVAGLDRVVDVEPRGDRRVYVAQRTGRARPGDRERHRGARVRPRALSGSSSPATSSSSRSKGSGRLRNRLEEPSTSAWSPSPKERVAQVTLPTKEQADPPAQDGAKQRSSDG